MHYAMEVSVSVFSGVIDDFGSVSETLTLMAGSSRVCVNVTIFDDNVDEGTESFIIRLANFAGLPQFRNSSTVFILDNGESVSFYYIHYC